MSSRVLGGLCALLASFAGAGSAPPAAARHLIYLHGRILQAEQSRRPVHPEFGAYELDAILAAFRARGFEVEGDVRPRGQSVSDAADDVVARVRHLLAAGTAADRITVVGASMGSGIALVAAARLQQPQLRFALLGLCFDAGVRQVAEGEGRPPAGRFLAFREKSDETSAPCTAWKDDPGLAPQLAAREIVLATGLRHGFLFRPLPEWVEPLARWAGDPP